MAPTRMLSTFSGAGTDAMIASAATINNGLIFIDKVPSGQLFDIRADFLIDTRHRGLEANFHVLVNLGNGDYISVAADGHSVLWDGTAEGLLAFNRTPVELNAIEYLQILRGGAVDASSVGRQLEIFIAYSVPSLREMIYTQEPLLIDVTL